MLNSQAGRYDKCVAVHLIAKISHKGGPSMTARSISGGLLRLGRRGARRAYGHRTTDQSVSLEQAARMSPEWGRSEVRHAEQMAEGYGPSRPAGWML